MTLPQWKRRMVFIGVPGVVVGLGLLVVGALLAGTDTAAKMTQGALVGSIGVVLLVLGGMLVKFAVAGPYPARFAEAGR